MEYTKEQLEKILNNLMQNNKSEVRAAVAEQGYGLDVLVNDSNIGVRSVVKETLEKQKNIDFVSVPISELYSDISLFIKPRKIPGGHQYSPELNSAINYLKNEGVNSINAFCMLENEELENKELWDDFGVCRKDFIVHIHDIAKENLKTITQNYVKWQKNNVTAVIFYNTTTDKKIGIILESIPKAYDRYFKNDFSPTELTAEERQQACKQFEIFAALNNFSVSDYVLASAEVVTKKEIKKLFPNALKTGVLVTEPMPTGVFEDLLADATARSKDTTEHNKDDLSKLKTGPTLD